MSLLLGATAMSATAASLLLLLLLLLLQAAVASSAVSDRFAIRFDRKARASLGLAVATAAHIPLAQGELALQVAQLVAPDVALKSK